MGQDPTLEFLRELDDPSKYTVRRNVPIGREFTRKIGDDVVKVTSADFPEIVENTARAEAEDGVVMRLVLGHVKAGADQTDQPPLVGYARGCRVGTFGPMQKPCMMADLYVKNTAYSGELKEFPYRSMEYRYDKKRIVGVALLKTDPYSQLGMVELSADGSAIITFSGDEMAEPAAPPPGQPPAQPAAPAGQAQMSAEDQQKAEALMQFYCSKYPALGKLINNGAGDEPKPEDKGGDGPPAKTEGSDVDKEKEAKMEAELNRLAKEADEAKVDAMLVKLEAVHECDVPHEKAILLKLSADDRTKYLDNARKRYPKKPVGEMLGVFGGNVEPTKTKPTELDQKGMEKCLALMEANPALDFASAREKVLSA